MTPSARWQGQQRRIGLTGGIATGKSSVGRHLEELGIPVLDADLFAHDALAPGGEGETAVLQRYGKRISTQYESSEENPKFTSRINRRALGSIVFNEPEERQWLEQLVHPYVHACFDEALAQLRDKPTVALMIPLLFEANITTRCSEVWVVHCRPEQQLERLQLRNGISKKEAIARIQTQWPMEKKLSLSDTSINNSGTQKSTRLQVETALKKL